MPIITTYDNIGKGMMKVIIMGLYDDLAMRKQAGEILKLESLTENDFEQLYFQEEMSDNEIADLFSVKKSKVAYRRKKLGVTLHNHAIHMVLQDKQQNEEAYQWLQDNTNLEMIAKAVTHDAFRNGPVEDIHTEGKLSQDDMKTLNKYMVNHLAYVFKLIQNGKGLELRLLIDTHLFYGTDWDPIEPMGRVD
jgi:predicted DNA-binding protein YlxM (UPF0122 family)